MSIKGSRDDLLVGEHPSLLEVRDRIARVAPSNVSVLVTGESGVGKELVARALHARSERARGPLVSVDCGALSDGLLESELFGHERGAFTGAGGQRIGRFERAHRGTLFLDEIANTSPSIQARLLRVLETGEVDRLGSSRSIAVDVRVVAATNGDLVELRERGRFRNDLFHRLNVFPIHMPALRDRRTDIPILVDSLSRREGIDLRWTEAATERLKEYPWPGNVRELLNVLRRLALLLDESQLVTPAVLESALDLGYGRTPRARFEGSERRRLAALLTAHRYNVSALARSIGLSRGALRHRLAKYDLL